MKLWDIVRNVHPWDESDAAALDTAPSSVLPGSLRISSVEESFFESAPLIIKVRNDEENLAGEVRKEDLRFFAAHCTNWFGDIVLDSLEVCIIAANEDGRIFYVNHAYEELLGVPVRKVVGRNIMKIEPESDLSEAIKKKKSIVNPRKHIKSVNRTVSLRIQPLVWKEEFHGAVSLFTDVTTLDSLNTEIERMNVMVDELRQQLDDNVQKTGIVTRDRHFLKLLEQAAVAARTNVPVLIRGENGVGKELVARYIHSCSERKDRPMVIVNCSSIPESLIESELFGYEEGSFTGAKKGGRMGKFELANHGTIFLDEIGDMPIALQSRLLRVIENGEIEKIGRQKNIPVDVRIIAATNQPLEKMIQEKRFRMDLFYRLNVISMSIPALRDRKEDIPVLADYFLREFCGKYGRERSISERGYKRLVEHEWRGNVRELRNCVERAVILSEGEALDFKDLAQPEAKEGNAGGKADPAVRMEWTALSEMKLEEALSAFEESCIRQALAESGGNRAEAIRRLGLSRRTFYRKCAQYGILEKGAFGEEEL
jgi:PAS domain S-box-containing protein